MKLNGHEIYRRIRSAGETYALGMAASASWELADRYVERVAQINALTQKMDAAWHGAASAGATSAMRPVTKAFEDSHSLLTTSRDTFVDQAHGYWRAFREVQYVPPAAPAEGLFDGFGPESDIDRAIADYNDKAHRNVMVYNGYHNQSVANGDQMPASYPTVPSGDGPSVTVSGDSRGPTADHRSDGARPGVDPVGAAARGAGGVTGWGAADTDGQPVQVGTVAPQAIGGSTTQPHSWGPQGTVVPSGQTGGVHVEPRLGGPGGGGPGAAGSWGAGGPVGPGGSAGWGPDARGGVGLVPPLPGGAASRSAPDGRAELPRTGVGGWPEARTRVSGEAPRPVTGTGGGPALGGGMWGAYPHQPDDDREHHRRYWRPPDSEDLFGIDDMVIAPSVIGAEPADGDDDIDGYRYEYGDTDEN
ncbi:hypothetical protein ALI22I_05325 [Saccharothrix sp. ALI-22-I]|uniref:hypothetical protein n=1 Tax=Saccharothrix sp. ALI-22-I TaxID=1933778 RepID=UPI00097BDF56|nr:hypothetical protein [Saccharothrix sp. ALI-22-I]ONI92209.1 hypothetical protein ALI22I_05325 [Saccharothrix sp. ALI-22-I]